MKKLLIIALSAMAFASCGGDDGPQGPQGGPQLPEKKAPYILYYDTQTETLAAGQWGSIDRNNLLSFKFGSVIGFVTPAANSTWNKGRVKFDPTESTTGYSDYTSIPYCDDRQEGDGYISHSDYHYPENVKAGKGDPCQLVGLKANATPEQIAAHNSGLYMPSKSFFDATYIGVDFMLTSTPASGRWLVYNDLSTFLPFTYLRNQFGIAQEMGGGYWSSFPYSTLEEDGRKQWGLLLRFDGSNQVSTDWGWNREFGFPVRCMPVE
jgi:hypothetical protein